MSVEKDRENPEPGPRGWVLLGTALAIALALEILETGAMESHTLVVELSERTGGWIGPAFLADLLRIVVLSIVLFGVGRFRPRHFGLRRERLAPGIGIVSSIWILTEIAILVERIHRTGIAKVQRGWETDAWTTMFGLAREILGEGLFVETFWRGYVMAWLIAELGRLMRDRGAAILLAIGCSQLVFASFQVPSRLAAGIPPGHIPVEIAFLALTGIYYAILYLRTGNLFILIGVHALGNAPIPLVEPGIDPAKLTILLASVFLFIPTAERPEAPPSGAAEGGGASGEQASPVAAGDP